MKFEQTEKPLTKEDIIDFENNINVKLPTDFKEHYLQFNGGYPPFEYVKGVKYKFTINGFIPIKYGILPIEQVIKDYKKNNITFINQIPFAYDNGGNIFFISVDEKDFGVIFIREVEFINDDDHKHFVHNSFFDFLDSFYSDN